MYTSLHVRCIGPTIKIYTYGTKRVHVGIKTRSILSRPMIPYLFSEMMVHPLPQKSSSKTQFEFPTNWSRFAPAHRSPHAYGDCAAAMRAQST